MCVCVCMCATCLGLHCAALAGFGWPLASGSSLRILQAYASQELVNIASKASTNANIRMYTVALNAPHLSNGAQSVPNDKSSGKEGWEEGAGAPPQRSHVPSIMTAEDGRSLATRVRSCSSIEESAPEDRPEPPWQEPQGEPEEHGQEQERDDDDDDLASLDSWISRTTPHVSARGAIAPSPSEPLSGRPGDSALQIGEAAWWWSAGRDRNVDEVAQMLRQVRTRP